MDDDFFNVINISTKSFISTELFSSNNKQFQAFDSLPKLQINIDNGPSKHTQIDD